MGTNYFARSFCFRIKTVAFILILGMTCSVSTSALVIEGTKNSSPIQTSSDALGLEVNGRLDSLVQPSDLAYLGAFRLPGGDDPPQTFAYGGNAMTFNPDGNPGSIAGLPGSLFIMGHDRLAFGGLPDGNQIAEISIPIPGFHSNPADLPSGTFLQNFQDSLAGFFTQMNEIPKAGLQYLNNPQSGPLLHVCWGQHLQPPDQASHAWLSPTLSLPAVQGIWFIGNQNLYSVNGYLFDVPSSWADTHALGRYLVTGRMRDGGQGGMGPTMFAYKPWLSNGQPQPTGTHLTETTLLLYENAYTTDEIVRCMNGYQHADEWEGGAWLSTSDGKSAVIFGGTKSNGTKYWYGFINPAGPEFPCVDTEVSDFTTCRMANGNPCPPEDFSGCCTDGIDCVTYRGWWSTRWDAQLIFYDPADLAQVAAGTIETWQPQPYASMDIDSYLYLNPPAWDEVNLGWGDQRRYRIGDVAYDRQNGYLYVMELYADGAKPVIHVWQVMSNPPQVPSLSFFGMFFLLVCGSFFLTVKIFAENAYNTAPFTVTKKLFLPNLHH